MLGGLGVRVGGVPPGTWVPQAVRTVRTVRRVQAEGEGLDFRQAERRDEQAQLEILRDLFGGAFEGGRPDPSLPSWGNGTVVRVAEAIYYEDRFGDLPVLADALEDAGCQDSTFLNHCRSSRTHNRGCWVLDVLLGKG